VSVSRGSVALLLLVVLVQVIIIIEIRINRTFDCELQLWNQFRTQKTTWRASMASHRDLDVTPSDPDLSSMSRTKRNKIKINK
jgi:hypothetical protein